MSKINDGGPAFPESGPRGQAVGGEDIMVNTPYDVFILPLRPSGLSSGPRFVVHVPGPQRESVTVRYDLSPAQTESAIRDALIRMGWTPPEGESAATVRAERDALRAESAELRERVGQLEYSNAVNANAKAQAARHAEEADRLRERVRELETDAERYRWLRDREIPEWLDLWHQNPDRIDSAIDQARGKGVQS